VTSFGKDSVGFSSGRAELQSNKLSEGSRHEF
jgi:hypothetical protein